MYDSIAALLDLINLIWSNVCGKVIDFMILTPDKYNESAWSMITSLYNSIFMPIAAVLIAIFFLYSFCKNCIDIKTEMRLELIVKSLIRMNIAEFFVIYNLEIIKTLFQFSSNIVQLIKNSSTMKFEPVDTVFIKSIEDMNIIEQVPILLITVVAFFTALISGISILYFSITRFFKFLCIIPFGAFAGATVAGQGSVTVSASSFYKYIIGNALDAVTIVIALFVSNAIIIDGGLNITGIIWTTPPAADNLGYILIKIIDTSLSLLLTAGLMKSGTTTVNRALALY